MSIRYKLIAVLLGIGGAVVMITGLLGYEAGKRGLTQTAMKQLTGIRRSKAHQIEAYFQSIRSQVRTLGESRLTVDAFREFRSEFRKTRWTTPIAGIARVACRVLQRILPSQTSQTG